MTRELELDPVHAAIIASGGCIVASFDFPQTPGSAGSFRKHVARKCSVCKSLEHDARKCDQKPVLP